MSENDVSEPLPQNIAEAQEQASEFGGFAEGETLTARKTGEKFLVPNVLMLDNQQLVDYEKLHHLLNQCDRAPDVEHPKQRFVHKNTDGTEVETETGGHTERGGFIQPYQKDGALIEPPYSFQLGIIYWGEEGFERFDKGGGRAAEIPNAMQTANRKLQERQAADSKSVGSGSDLAAGADSD